MGYDVNKYTNVAKWYARAQRTIECYKEINEEGNDQLKQVMKKYQKWKFLSENVLNVSIVTK